MRIITELILMTQIIHYKFGISYFSLLIISYCFQVKIPGSYNYRLVVECVDPSHILMRRDRAEAICDTDTGIISTTKLTACARTIKPSTN